VVAMGDVQVFIYDEVFVNAMENSHITAGGNAHVTALDHCTVDAYEYSEILIDSPFATVITHGDSVRIFGEYDVSQIQYSSERQLEGATGSLAHLLKLCLVDGLGTRESA
jgi:hypothetical protein